MASLVQSVNIKADPDSVWDALRDFGALHKRLAPNFVTECRLEDKKRYITFSNGMSVCEQLVSIDDDRRRLVWTVVGEPFEHHNGAATVTPEQGGGCNFEWQADLLPDELAAAVEPMMREGLDAIKRHLESVK